ncbi:unnamed protein product [Peniophora sp. CBMAI 1063]|nr:unnamed protein product [Peniophora sp. CBMAI 1063]
MPSTIMSPKARAIDVLPAEVLQLILVQLVSLTPITYDYDISHDDIIIKNLGWLAFGIVCRRWRSAAASCPRVYANALTQAPDRIRKFAGRAGQVAAHIQFDRNIPSFSSFPRRQRMLRFMESVYRLPAFQNAESIVVEPPYDAIDLVTRLVKPGRTFLNLRTLSIAVSHQLYPDPYSDSDIVVMFLDKASNNPIICPNLKEVFLSGVWIGFKAEKLEKLEQKTTNLNQEAPGLSRWWSVTIGATVNRLTTLVLDSAFRILEDQDLESFCRTRERLVSLQSLDISGTAVSICQLLRKVILPDSISSVQLTVTKRVSGDEEDIMAISHYLDFANGAYWQFTVEFAAIYPRHSQEFVFLPIILGLREASAQDKQEHQASLRQHRGLSKANFTFAIDCPCMRGPQARWERMLCSLVKGMSTKPLQSLSFRIPENFYKAGRTDWQYLRSNIGDHLTILSNANPKFVDLHDVNYITWMHSVQGHQSIYVSPVL